MQNQILAKGRNSRQANALQTKTIARRSGSPVYREVKVVTVTEKQFPADCKSNKIDSPENIVGFWRSAVARSSWYHEDKEHLVCICLDTRLRLKHFSLVSVGSIDETISHPREMFRPAIADAARSIIVVHNHPSGDPSPSNTDIALTRRIYAAGELLQIPLFDHVIVGGQREYFSFREDSWPPRSTRGRRVTAQKLEELRVEEGALQVIRGGPALAARNMDHDSLAGAIKEQIDTLEEDPAYMHGPRAEIIAALALELYDRSRKKVGEQK